MVIWSCTNLLLKFWIDIPGVIFHGGYGIACVVPSMGQNMAAQSDVLHTLQVFAFGLFFVCRGSVFGAGHISGACFVELLVIYFWWGALGQVFYKNLTL